MNAASNPITTPELVRQLTDTCTGDSATDGDGVRLTRLIGSTGFNVLDPFLLFDVFESDVADDYIGGFPPHPHRGFETVTYLIEGRLRHKDNAGHEGVIESGGVQWMTAGRGIVHSEMPEQENGLLQGVQLWINLPASRKMQPPKYQEHDASSIPLQLESNGTRIRVIAGQTDSGTRGPFINDSVQPLYLDVSLPGAESWQQSVKANDNVFIYVLQGELQVDGSTLGQGQLGVLSDGTQVQVTATVNSRFLLLAAQPLNEPIARGGPFVMNTKAEVLQAFEDFQNNRF